MKAIQRTMLIISINLSLFTYAYAEKMSSDSSKRHLQVLCEKFTLEELQGQSLQESLRMGKGVDPLLSPSLARSATHPQPLEGIFKIGLNFSTVTVANSQFFGVFPPNQAGWVGFEQYIISTYNSLRSYNKKTGEPDGVLNIDAGSFMGVVSPRDIRMVYDSLADRWLWGCEDSSNNDLVLVVSEEANLSKCSRFHRFRVPSSQLSSAPGFFSNMEQLAFDQNAVYMSCSIGGVSDAGTTVVVFQKQSLLEGHPRVTLFENLLALTYQPIIPPAINFDKKSKFGYLISSQSSYGSRTAIGATLNFFRVVNPESDHPMLVGTGATPAASNPILLEVPPYTYLDYFFVPHKGNLYGIMNGGLQPGLFGAIDSVHVRNKQLYACHNIMVDQTGFSSTYGNRIGVRWYRFDLTGDPSGRGKGQETALTVPALVECGTLYDNRLTSSPLYYFCPALMTNPSGDLVIECTVSGLDAYTDVVYAARSRQAPLNMNTFTSGLSEPIYLTHNNFALGNNPPLMHSFNSEPSYIDDGLGQRWGDFSTLAPDPCSDIIWSTGQWAAVQNGVGSQATQLIPIHSK